LFEKTWKMLNWIFEKFHLEQTIVKKLNALHKL
jgi:hypothetical protein